MTDNKYMIGDLDISDSFHVDFVGDKTFGHSVKGDTFDILLLDGKYAPGSQYEEPIKVGTKLVARFGFHNPESIKAMIQSLQACYKKAIEHKKGLE